MCVCVCVYSHLCTTVLCVLVFGVVCVCCVWMAAEYVPNKQAVMRTPFACTVATTIKRIYLFLHSSHILHAYSACTHTHTQIHGDGVYATRVHGTVAAAAVVGIHRTRERIF